MSRMKKILCLSLVFLIMLGLTACINKEDNKRNIVSKTQPLANKEEVPEYVMTKEVFKNKDGEIYGTVKYNYDDQGHLLEVKYINQEGKVIESKRFKYNEQGLRTKRIVTKACKKRMSEEWRYNTYDRKKLREKKPEEVWYIKVAGWPIWKEGTTTYKYNKWGQLITYKEVKKDGTKVRWGGIEYYKNGERKYKWIERYDGAKQEIYYNEDGKWMKKVTNYEEGGKKIKKADYDNDGNMIEEIIKEKNEDGEMTRHSIFKNKYTKNNRLKKTIRIGEIHNLHSISRYKYDDNGNKVEMIEKDKNGKVDNKYVYKYDNKNYKEKFIHINDGEVWYVVEYKYSKGGNKRKEIEKKSSGKVKKTKKYYYKKIR